MLSSWPVIQPRHPLVHLSRALANKQVTLGFLGGSITDGRPRHNWPEPVISWLVERFPETGFTVENAAIGATGSDLAVFRAQRDILAHHCDIVFVEYAVNDPAPTPTTLHSREGLLRKLLAPGTGDVVLAYTFSQPMYGAMLGGEIPGTIAEFEQLAQHYDLPSVWMGLAALRQVMAGQMRWDEWLPDGLHPHERGSLSYGASIIELLTSVLAPASDQATTPPRSALPPPLAPGHWGDATTLPLEAANTQGPWVLRRWPQLGWIDQVLSTSAVGARLQIPFSGRGLALGFDFGATSAEFRYRIDAGEWTTSVRERPDWCGPSGWFRLSLLAEDLPVQPHLCEIEVIHGDRPECRGTNFDLALIGVLP